MAILSKNTTIGGKNPVLSKEITDTTVNLNDYKTEGEYIFTKVTYFSHFPNVVGSYFYLKVVEYSETCMLQILTSSRTDTSYLYIRYMDDNQWGSWRKIPTFANKIDADTVNGLTENSFVRNYGKSYNDFNNLHTSGFYQVVNAQNAPVGYNTLWGCIVIQTDGNLSSSRYVAQIATRDNTTDVNEGQTYIRKWRNSSWSPWEKLWTTANDGNGSGLDADLLDGKHADAFASSDINTYYINSQADFDYLIGQQTWAGKTTIVLNCDVNAGSNPVNIPSNVKLVNGNNHIISNCVSIQGYESQSIHDRPSIMNLTVIPVSILQFNGLRYINNVNKCVVKLNTNSNSSSYGFNECSNLNNCIVEFITSDLNNDILNIGFFNCDVLNSCSVTVRSNSTDEDINIIAISGSKNLNNCFVEFEGTGTSINNDVYGLFSSCDYVNNCYVITDRIYSGNVFDDCHWVTNCELKITGNYNQSHYSDYGYTSCTSLTNCLADNSRGFDECQYGWYSSKSASNTQITDCATAHDLSSLINNLNQCIQKVDGSGSGIDADLLDGLQAQSYARYGSDTTLATTNQPAITTSGKAAMYRFTDSSNVIGEGTGIVYGIIQIYYNSNSYVRLAISTTSGKIYRQTNTVTSWNEISANASPTIPVLTADPTNTNNGQIWIRSDL